MGIYFPDSCVQNLQKMLLRRMCKDTETLRFMTRFMITERKQRAMKSRQPGTARAWAQPVLAGKNLFCIVKRLLLFFFLFIVPFLSKALPDNTRGHVLRAADIEECSLTHLTAPLSPLKGPGLSSPDLIFSNEFLKATFPAQVFVSQCNALHVLKHRFLFIQWVKGQTINEVK